MRIQYLMEQIRLHFQRHLRTWHLDPDGIWRESQNGKVLEVGSWVIGTVVSTSSRHYLAPERIFVAAREEYLLVEPTPLAGAFKITALKVGDAYATYSAPGFAPQDDEFMIVAAKVVTSDSPEVGRSSHMGP